MDSASSVDVILSASTVFMLPVLLMLIASYVVVMLMEGSLHPFDVLEAEPEIVAGYYVDYGGHVFMVIYLAEGITLCTVLCDGVSWCVLPLR